MHINLGELMCLFTLLRHYVRMENATKPLYSNVSLEFHVFLKTETSHSRARTLQNAISATDFEVDIVISRFCVSAIYMYIIAPRSTPELPVAFLERPGEANVPEYILI